MEILYFILSNTTLDYRKKAQKAPFLGFIYDKKAIFSYIENCNTKITSCQQTYGLLTKSTFYSNICNVLPSFSRQLQLYS